MHLYGQSDKHGQSRQYTHVHNVIRVVVMGAAGVGKTSLIKQCLYREFDENYKETIEDTFHYKGDNFDLEILDTSGSYNFPDMIKLAMKSGDIFVLVFSVEDAFTFERVSQLRKEIMDIRGPEVPVIIVGNKSDSEVREVSNALADSIACIDWGCSYHDVTAMDADATCEIFNAVLKHYPSLYGEKISSIQYKEKVAMRDYDMKKSQICSKVRSSLTMLAKKIHSIK